MICSKDRIWGSSKNHCHLKYIPRPEKTSETSNSFWRTVSHSLSLLQPASHRSGNDFNMLWELRVTNPTERDEKLWIVNSTESLGKKLIKGKQRMNVVIRCVFVCFISPSYSQSGGSKKEQQQQALVSLASLFCTSGVPTSIYRLAKPSALSSTALHQLLSRKKTRLYLT